MTMMLLISYGPARQSPMNVQRCDAAALSTVQGIHRVHCNPPSPPSPRNLHPMGRMTKYDCINLISFVCPMNVSKTNVHHGIIPGPTIPLHP